jgi:hypothetical protein
MKNPDCVYYAVDQAAKDSAKEVNGITAEMRDYIKSIIVSGDVDLLIGGQFIIAPGAKISSCHSMVISAICGGTISDIKENFDEYGSIKTISKLANVKDNRPKKKARD